ncbi:MAG: hypothetical protein JSS66_04105 [Armatimonadetes bacterium]|nr:hypothetical protein [Armatimonadota bacterium]
MNKVLSVCLSVTVVLAPVASRADSLLEKIATSILADQFGIDTREVLYVRDQSHLPVWELGPVFQGSYYFHRSPNEVWRLRNQGLGWGEIAHRMGMHPGTFNKLRKQGAFDRDRFWTDSYSRRFGYNDSEVLHRKAGSLEDVLGAIVIGKLSNRDPREVYNQQQTVRSWNSVADKYHVRFEDWQRVSRSSGKTSIRNWVPRETAKSSPGNSAFGHDKAAHGNPHGGPPGKEKHKSSLEEKGGGKGKGQRKGNGQGKGHGHADDNGRDDGHGEGRGKGKSNGSEHGQGNGHGNGNGKHGG